MSILAERAERHPVSFRGFALSPTRDCDIRVSDISYTGCKFSCGDPFAAGEIVELRILKRGAIEAEIRWSADGRAGARFMG
jgi:PilZ domain